MNIGFVSIDNFYDDPYSVRGMALNAEYYQPGYSKLFTSVPGPFPGKMTIEQYSPNDIDKKVSKLLQKNLRQNRNYDSGRFRISKATDICKSFVHVDDSDKDAFAGVLYLSLPEHCNNKIGTIFYNYKNSGRNSVSNNEEWKNILASNDFNDNSKWDINLISYNVFNRLIIYPMNSFHAIGELFGDTDENARLIQLFCWREIT